MFLTLLNTYSAYVRICFGHMVTVPQERYSCVRECSASSHKNSQRNIVIIIRRETEKPWITYVDIQAWESWHGPSYLKSWTDLTKRNSTIKVVTESVTRGHQHKIEKRRYNYKSHMNTFTARSVNPWNSLPTKCNRGKRRWTVLKVDLTKNGNVNPIKFYYNF